MAAPFISRLALKNWELRPEVATGGTEAIEHLTAASKTDAFKLIVLDLMMPEMDGMELAQAISNDQGIRQPAMIMLSSAGNPPSHRQLEKAGINRCLTKPVKQSDLLDAIGDALGVATRDQPNRQSIQKRPEHVPKLQLLLAEDGRVNQMVAINLLKERGHERWQPMPRILLMPFSWMCKCQK